MTEFPPPPSKGFGPEALYEAEIRAPLASLVTQVSDALAVSGVGAALIRSGDKQAPGVLYIHIDPQGCFAAAGFFRPDAGTLRRLRYGMVRRPGRWAKVKSALAACDLVLQYDDTPVKSPEALTECRPRSRWISG